MSWKSWIRRVNGFDLQKPMLVVYVNFWRVWCDNRVRLVWWTQVWHKTTHTWFLSPTPYLSCQVREVSRISTPVILLLCCVRFLSRTTPRSCSVAGSVRRVPSPSTHGQTDGGTAQVGTYIDRWGTVQVDTYIDRWGTAQVGTYTDRWGSVQVGTYADRWGTV